jgi:hypothetical protein
MENLENLENLKIMIKICEGQNTPLIYEFRKEFKAAGARWLPTTKDWVFLCSSVEEAKERIDYVYSLRLLTQELFGSRRKRDFSWAHKVDGVYYFPMPHHPEKEKIIDIGREIYQWKEGRWRNEIL